MKLRLTSSILASLIIVFAISYTIINNDNRALYEESILQKASTIQQLNSQKQEGLKSPDQPDMAAFQEYLMTADPVTETVPKERLMDAYRETRSLENEANTSRNEGLMSWETSGSNMGGRTRAMMFDPNDSQSEKVWAGGITGGLWYTNDITNTYEQWVPVGDFWSNLAISCITYDPNNTETFYVGTGEAQTARIIYRASSGVGAGIFVSHNAGENWEQLATTENFDYITDIAVRNENGISAIYACVASGTYEGVDHISNPSDGVFRSIDGGETWEQVLPLIPTTMNDEPYTPADIEIAANGRIYVGTMENLNGKGGATILYSDSGLAGSWTIYDEYNQTISNESYYKIPARTLVASSPSDPNIVYAQFAAGYNNGFIYYRGRYMAKSDDSGENWSEISIPNDEWSTLAWHAFVLKVDPTDPDAVYTGGLDLYKSKNGGDSWLHISDWAQMYYGGGDNYVHADQHCIKFRPGTPTFALFSSDGGIFMTETANYSSPVFIERNQGFGTLQFYSCSMKPTPFSKYYIGGLQDNGTLFHKGQPLDIDDMIDGGDGAYCFWDQDNASVYITSVYYNQYTSYDNEYAADNFGGNSGTFISPADYDYKENILYSNACDFFGGNADRLLRSSGIPYNVQDNMINLGTGISVPFSHICNSNFAPDGTTTLFVGSASGRLYKVTNAESNPETTEIGSNDFPTANLSCVAIGEDEDHLLVTFSNYGVSSVWYTEDGGQSWIEKESNLPDMPIRWALIHPENTDQALLATEIGVWWTNTLKHETTIWTPANDGMANVRVDMLKWRNGDDIVLAATHGRGLFTSPYNVNPYTGINDIATYNNDLRVYPNPAVDNINIEGFSENTGIVDIVIYNTKGESVFSESTESNINSINIDLPNLANGNYIVTATSGKTANSCKLIINK